MRFNWSLWAALPLSLITFFSYPFVFIRWPVTRDLPWVNILLGLATIVLMVLGLRRAWQPGRYRVLKGLAASVVAILGGLVLWSFVYGVLIVPRHLPASAAAPRIGQRAPAFTLPDIDSHPVALSDLLTTPIRTTGGSRAPKGVLLIFYRGYW